MGTLISLGVGQMEIDWGKNNIYRDHSEHFKPEDIKMIPYYYVDDDGCVITEQKEGLCRSSLTVYYYINEIRSMRSILHKAFKDLPLLRDFSDQTIENYVKAYNQSCSMIFHTKPIDAERIKFYISTHLPPLPSPNKTLIAQMTLLEIFLRNEMQIVVAELVERQVNIILSRL